MISRARLPFVVAFLIALLLLWQATRLESWTFLGPGPGLFPQITTAVSTVLAFLLICFPGESAPGEAPGEAPDSPPPGPQERRLFVAYGLALPFLVVASALLGFIAMSVVLALALTWGAERRSFLGALAFGLGCGIAGVFVFGRLLGASVPELALEQRLLGLVF